MHEKFKILGKGFMYECDRPHDPILPPEQFITCNCDLIYFGDEDYVDDGNGHILLKNQPLAVCDKTAGALAALERDDIFISESTFHYDGGGCC